VTQTPRDCDGRERGPHEQGVHELGDGVGVGVGDAAAESSVNPNPNPIPELVNALLVGSSFASVAGVRKWKQT
jgi:hypothetical protein